MYAKQSRIETTSGAFNKAYLVDTLDDLIVRIVPKTLFNTVNQTLHIGKEYGFFINTEQKDNYFTSTVLVFDIELNANLNVTNGVIDSTIKPIFQYN